MSSFDDRKKGEEAKFAHNAELRFKAEVRRNKLVGMWAAEKLGLTGAAAAEYAQEVVASDFAEAGDDDVLRKISGDFRAKGIALGDDVIRAEMNRLVEVAREQVLREG